MRWLFVLAAVTGCASASIDKNNPGDDDPIDAPDEPPIDAPPPVDAPISVDLVQTQDQNVVPTQIGCQQVDPLTNFTTENSYYRTFPLADFGITVPFHITSVSFSIERATAGNGVSQSAQLRLGTYTGTLDAATFPTTALQPLASATIEIPNNATGAIVTPISAFTPSTLTVEPGTVIYAELFIPDGRDLGNIFYIGSNAGTETHPSYIRAPECAANDPVSYDTAVGDPLVRILLSVSGTR